MMMKTRSHCAILLLAALALPAAAVTSFVPLESTATYLHTDQDSPTPPPALALALRLSDYGFAPGDRLSLQVVGDIDNGPGGDTLTFTLGVFSSSQLLGNEQRERVVGALASDGPAFVSSPTCIGAHSTDIAQDFGFDRSAATLVTVPPGAANPFLAKHDQWYHDKSDPDHDCGVLIGLAPVPEPASAALLLTGGALLAARRRGLMGARA